MFLNIELIKPSRLLHTKKLFMTDLCKTKNILLQHWKGFNTDVI